MYEGLYIMYLCMLCIFTNFENECDLLIRVYLVHVCVTRLLKTIMLLRMLLRKYSRLKMVENG